MSETANVNKFVAVVDEFMANYARLNSNDAKTAVANSGDPALIAEYNSQLGKATALKNTIEATTGAWQSAKQFYLQSTDTSSMYIGDAVDWIRSKFGYDPAPGFSGLGALQIPAAAWIAGIIAAAVLMNSAMKKLFVAIEASKIQRQNPSVSRADAVAQASRALAVGGFFSFQNAPLFIGGAIALWVLLR